MLLFGQLICSHLGDSDFELFSKVNMSDKNGLNYCLDAYTYATPSVTAIWAFFRASS